SPALRDVPEVAVPGLGQSGARSGALDPVVDQGGVHGVVGDDLSDLIGDDVGYPAHDLDALAGRDGDEEAVDELIEIGIGVARGGLGGPTGVVGVLDDGGLESGRLRRADGDEETGGRGRHADIDQVIEGGQVQRVDQSSAEANVADDGRIGVQELRGRGLDALN